MYERQGEEDGIRIARGRVIDPAPQIDGVADVVVRDGVIVAADRLGSSFDSDRGLDPSSGLSLRT